ncbi:MAG: hypothetical protein AAGK21_02565 [Bacteroidota bacterium]
MATYDVFLTGEGSQDSRTVQVVAGSHVISNGFLYLYEADEPSVDSRSAPIARDACAFFAHGMYLGFKRSET